MLDAPIPGLDHLKAIDPFQLCNAVVGSGTDSDILNLVPLSDFNVAAGDKSWQWREKPRWRPAADGLKAVRGLLAHYEAQIAKGERSVGGLIPSALPARAAILRQLETVLDKADTYDRRFYLAVKDLP